MPSRYALFLCEARATLPIAAPLAAANLAQMAMGVTNTIMVGHLGAEALSAAGLGGGLYFTFSIICQGVLYAVAPLIAEAMGRRDYRTAGEVTGAGLLLAAAAAPAIMALLSLAARLLLKIGYQPALANDVGVYLGAIRWGVPGFLVFGVMRSLFAASLRARTVMLVVLAAIPANGFLCWTLVFGHFGLPALGIAGSGWATATIQSATSLALVAIVLLAPRRTPLRAPRALRRDIAEILRLGLPIGGTIALETLVFAVTGILMGLFGADALAAHQLVLNFVGLAFMVPLGIGQAATVRVAHALGAGETAEARRAAAAAVALAIGFMGLAATTMLAAPRLLIGVYLDLADPANAGAVAIALRLLTIAAFFQIADGVQTVAAAGLRGYRDTTVPMLLAGIGYWAIGFCGGWVLAFPLGHGPTGLWYGLALGLIAVATLLTLRLALRARAAITAASAAPLPAPVAVRA